LPETVEDRISGWIVPPNDAATLARTIVEIVTHPQSWCDYGAAARTRFEAVFAAPAITRQFQAIVRARLTAQSSRRTTRDFGVIHAP
jgi:glycosyltransferase involved in cell wall biosynthesis